MKPLEIKDERVALEEKLTALNKKRAQLLAGYISANPEVILGYLSDIDEDLLESQDNESFCAFLSMLQFNDDLIPRTDEEDYLQASSRLNNREDFYFEGLEIVPGGEYRDLHFRNLVAEVRTQAVLYQYFRKKNPTGILKRDFLPYVAECLARQLMDVPDYIMGELSNKEVDCIKAIKSFNTPPAGKEKDQLDQRKAMLLTEIMTTTGELPLSALLLPPEIRNQVLITMKGETDIPREEDRRKNDAERLINRYRDAREYINVLLNLKDGHIPVAVKGENN